MMHKSMSEWMSQSGEMGYMGDLAHLGTADGAKSATDGVSVMK